MKTKTLYKIAENNNIDVYRYPLGIVESMSTPGNVVLDTDIKEEAKEKVHLAHELGHCMTNAFYYYWNYETHGRMEERANRWAYKKLMPLSELEEALSCGITETWELAEYFGIDEETLIKAIEYYKEKVLL